MDGGRLMKYSLSVYVAIFTPLSHVVMPRVDRLFAQLVPRDSHDSPAMGDPDAMWSVDPAEL